MLIAKEKRWPQTRAATDYARRIVINLHKVADLFRNMACCQCLFHMLGYFWSENCQESFVFFYPPEHRGPSNWVAQWWSAHHETGRLDLCPGHSKDCKNGSHSLPAWQSEFTVRFAGDRTPNDSQARHYCCPLLPQGLVKYIDSFHILQDSDIQWDFNFRHS